MEDNVLQLTTCSLLLHHITQALSISFISLKSSDYKRICLVVCAQLFIFHPIMGNCIALSANETSLTKERGPLPIETIFELPSLLTSWPSVSGKGFASGSMNLGGLEVRQVTTFTKVWATLEGGKDNLGATFFKPSQIPAGFYMLGYYSQPNNKPLFGSVLVAKGESDGDIEGGMLRKPVDFTLVWSNQSLNQEGNGYIWAPTPPQGYVAVGHMVTNSPQKPSVNEIRCVRADLAETCESDMWVWGTGPESNSSWFNVYSSGHTSRRTQAVRTGTFIAQVNGATSPSACLKNLDASLSSMPNVRQIGQLMGLYSPFIYFHPDEPYLPSSVAWFFNSGALLYKKGDPNPAPIDQNGSNLPQGGWSDDTYWLDLPIDNDNKEAVKKGDLKTSKCYVHVKPMFGESFTDIAIWVFYPFNGPGRAKVIIVDLPLGRIGEHVADWEHVTLRISNLDGKLKRVYFSEHSGGIWVEASELEYQGGGTKPVVYASLHGHAFFPKAGLVLQGNAKLGIGIRNDAGKGAGMDTGLNYVLVAAEYLGSGRWGVVEPPWLNYSREWGPKINYNIEQELDDAAMLLPGHLKPIFKQEFHALPKEVQGEEGPTGPKMKNSWNGDE